MLTFLTLSALIFGIIFTGNLLAEGILSRANDKSNDNDLALDGIFFHW